VGLDRFLRERVLGSVHPPCGDKTAARMGHPGLVAGWETASWTIYDPTFPKRRVKDGTRLILRPKTAKSKRGIY